MRITNILPDPQYFSYASSAPGGRKLAPGEASPVLPFKVLCNDQLWKDLRSNKIRIRLDKGDKDFIKDLTDADVQEIKVKPRTVVALPPPPKRVAPKPLPKALQPAKSIQTVMGGVPIMNPAVPVTQESIKKGQISLKDLQALNSSGMPKFGTDEKSNLKQIAEHMKGRF